MAQVLMALIVRLVVISREVAHRVKSGWETVLCIGALKATQVGGVVIGRILRIFQMRVRILENALIY